MLSNIDTICMHFMQLCCYYVLLCRSINLYVCLWNECTVKKTADLLRFTYLIYLKPLAMCISNVFNIFVLIEFQHLRWSSAIINASTNFINRSHSRLRNFSLSLPHISLPRFLTRYIYCWFWFWFYCNFKLKKFFFYRNCNSQLQINV